MIDLFAHSEEKHISTSENLLHLLEVWYTAIPIYLFITFVVIAGTFYISKKSFTATFVIGAGWLLVSGVLLYDLSPAASAIGIVLGLLISAVTSLMSLTKTK